MCVRVALNVYITVVLVLLTSRFLNVDYGTNKQERDFNQLIIGNDVIAITTDSEVKFFEFSDVVL